MASNNSKLPITLVFDADVLIGLRATIDEKLRMPSANGEVITDYFRILQKLAELGVRIVIPEMVALEVGDVVSKGNLAEIFPRNAQNRRMCEPEIAEFFEEIRHNEIRNVRMTGTNSDTPVSRFLRQLNRILENENIDSIARTAVIDLRKKFNTQHFGEMQAAEIIGGMPNGSGTIIFVSDEAEARQRVINLRKPNVGAANLPLFFNALSDAGLFEKIGLKGRVAYGRNSKQLRPDAEAILFDLSVQREANGLQDGDRRGFGKGYNERNEYGEGCSIKQVLSDLAFELKFPTGRSGGQRSAHDALGRSSGAQAKTSGLGS